MRHRPIFPAIRRPVIILGVVSLFTDMASEMLYPVLPMYLTSVLGASMVTLGVLEGAAEAVAGIFKGFFGRLSDRLGRRTPFVIIGYALSALSKPLPGIFPLLSVVAASRIADRLGKATRTAPRDALLAAHAPPGAHGAVFGFHRAMDTVGAALGPAAALLYLWIFPEQYRMLFIIAFVPSIAASLLTLFVREAAGGGARAARGAPGMRAAISSGGPAFRRVLAALAIFSLLNSSDVFLIMRARAIGFSDSLAIASYIFYNLIYAAAAYPLGRLSDAWGKKRTLFIGFVIYTAVYLGFARISSAALIWPLFGLYGIYAAMTESVAKAWVGELIPRELGGSGFGLLTMVTSLGAIGASGFAGWLWEAVDPAAPFYAAAAGALFSAVIILGVSNGETARRAA